VISNPKYLPEAPRPAVAIDQLRIFCASGHHHYWDSAPSLRDGAVYAFGAARGHAQITDLCLLGLAKTMKGALATFDRTIPLGGVNGATRDHLMVIEPVTS
jgi:hypothetical protein